MYGKKMIIIGLFDELSTLDLAKYSLGNSCKKVVRKASLLLLLVSMKKGE